HRRRFRHRQFSTGQSRHRRHRHRHRRYRPSRRRDGRRRSQHPRCLSIVRFYRRSLTMNPALRPQPEEKEHAMDEAEYFRAIGRLEAQVANLANTITEMKVKIDSLDRMANRWKGGFTVILGVGAFIGFM